MSKLFVSSVIATTLFNFAAVAGTFCGDGLPKVGDQVKTPQGFEGIVTIVIPGGDDTVRVSPIINDAGVPVPSYIYHIGTLLPSANCPK